MSNQPNQQPHSSGREEPPSEYQQRLLRELQEQRAQNERLASQYNAQLVDLSDEIAGLDAPLVKPMRKGVRKGEECNRWLKRRYVCWYIGFAGASLGWLLLTIVVMLGGPNVVAIPMFPGGIICGIILGLILNKRCCITQQQCERRKLYRYGCGFLTIVPFPDIGCTNSPQWGQTGETISAFSESINMRKGKYRAFCVTLSLYWNHPREVFGVRYRMIETLGF